MKASLDQEVPRPFHHPLTSFDVSKWLERKLVPSFAAERRRLTADVVWLGALTSLIAGVVVFAYFTFVHAAGAASPAGGARAAGLTMAVFGAMAALLYPIVHHGQNRLLSAASMVAQNNIESLVILGKLVEMRDPDTAGHNLRVTTYALMFSEALGLPADVVMRCTKGALLHDIGKLAVPDQILGKPGPLTHDERQVMQTHVDHGVAIVMQADAIHDAESVVGGHHERFDGTGYPQGLAGEEIPLEARIFALIDVFDALTSRRVYKPPMSIHEALDLMREGRGAHFDPHLLDQFLQLAPGFASQLPHEEEELLAMLMERVSPYLRNILPKQMLLSVTEAALSPST